MRTTLFALLSLMLWACQTNDIKEENAMNSTLNEKAPVCEKKPYNMEVHGHERLDNYFWLNDREDDKVVEYLNQENAHTKSVMADTENLQEELFKEMKSRIKEEDESVPYFKNGFFYKTKYIEGGEYPIFVRSKDDNFENEEIILDGNKMAEGYDYFDISGFEISPDNNMVAYAIDTVSRRLYTIMFKDLKSGKTFSDQLPNSDGSFAWANDNKTLFYSTQDEETLRSDKVRKHILGDDVKVDEIVFEENDDTFGCYVYKTNSEKYVLLHSSSTLTDEYQILDADNIDSGFKMFQERIIGLEYAISHYKDKFFVQTNKDGATNFKLMTTDVENTSIDNWNVFVEHREETLLEDITTLTNHLILSERTNGLLQLKVINLSNKEEYYIPFNDETYVAYTSGNTNFETNKLKFWYTSLTTPGTTYEFDLDTRETEVLKQTTVLGDFNSEDYISDRVFIVARDGVKVPISLVYKKGTPLDGSAPLLQYSYGSYGSSTSPYFSSTRLSLLNRGFIFAIAHVRGGEEMGRQWYEDGKLLNKWNTFNDFIDCSKYLIEQNYTAEDRLFAMGGSAGGLLMGVVANEAPELYQGIIAAVPFVDVMTTMLDETIPLTTGEYDEWGNPNDKEYYDYMLSYSPYDQVKAQDYPNMLVTTGLHDSQVQYWEPAKWVAKLRDMKTDNNILLLETNMSAGHGGASGRFEYLKEVALEFAFMIKLSPKE